MAITTTTFLKSAGWARTDVLHQLEQAFTWLDLHGTQISGLVTSISAYSGGGTVGTAYTEYYDVPVATTTGIGTGATFNVRRNSGTVNGVYVNRPGYGYTQGEYVTLSAANIGGGSAVAIGITVNVDGGASPVGYGSTNQFFDKNYTPSSDSTRPWAVLKQNFDTSKTFGVTYRGFKVYSDYQMNLYAGPSFFPFNTNNTSDRGGYYRDSFRGTYLLDISSEIDSTNASLDYNHRYAQISSLDEDVFTFASPNSPTTNDLKLNVYRSSIDPDFAVLSFNQPSISGTINDSTFATFIIHNFTSNLYNFDEVFSAGVTFVVPDPSANTENEKTALLGFRTYLCGNKYLNNQLMSSRAAESGWSQVYNQDNHYGIAAQNYTITSSQSSYININENGVEDYQVPKSIPATIFTRNGGFKDKGKFQNDSFNASKYYGNLNPITTYTSVIKGIPINGNLIPCPYYIPDDFVLIDFKLTTSGQDIKQGDTITISGSEVYTVITGSYNKYGETAGILFCARTV